MKISRGAHTQLSLATFKGGMWRRKRKKMTRDERRMTRGRVTGKRGYSERKQMGEGGNDRVFFYVSCIYYKIHYFCGSKNANKIQKNIG